MEQTDSLTTLFRHNLWANLRLLAACADLTEEQLATDMPGTYGTIQDTLAHVVRAERSYFARISTGRPAPRPPTSAPPSLAELVDSAELSGTGLCEWAGRVKADDTVTVDWDGSPRAVPKTVILTQAINHANEHRAQVMVAMTHLGVQPPDLSGWTFFDEADF